MLEKYLIRKNHYSDSIALMRVAADLEALPGIFQATAVMATAANLNLARTVGLIDDTIEPQPNNLLIAVSAENEKAADAAFSQAEAQMDNLGSIADGSENCEPEVKSIEMAVSRDPGLNLALISCPGEYAAAEAKKALNLGLHVMLFSDNVSIQAELELKKISLAKNLLMMGPDCGTAIINGLPLGFANIVARGSVGIVSASGTGLQQISSLLTQWGVGISQAIGTGGRDLSDEIGGISMAQGVEILIEDEQTEVIVLISKPPSKKVAEKIITSARAGGKPVIVCFLGSENNNDDNMIQFATTLDAAAEFTYSKLNGGNLPNRMVFGDDITTQLFDQKESQKYIRGIYSGGTFCYETQSILRDLLGPVWSSTPIDKAYHLKDSWSSQEHTIIDLGDDEFTQGRAHPMIDHRTRHERILQEASDPETAVILFDVVIGCGSHANPAAEMVNTIKEARKISTKEQRQIYFIGFVCGTDMDPQNLTTQIKILKSASVIVAESNAEATRRATSVILTNSTGKKSIAGSSNNA